MFLVFSLIRFFMEERMFSSVSRAWREMEFIRFEPEPAEIRWSFTWKIDLSRKRVAPFES